MFIRTEDVEKILRILPPGELSFSVSTTSEVLAWCPRDGNELYVKDVGKYFAQLLEFVVDLGLSLSFTPHKSKRVIEQVSFTFSKSVV